MGGTCQCFFDDESISWPVLSSYHYCLPLGVVHHRIYRSIADHVDRVYGPTIRLLRRTTKRIHDSFASGKQQEAWSLIWRRVSSADGAKLWVRMCNHAREASERAKEVKKDDSDKSSDAEK